MLKSIGKKALVTGGNGGTSRAIARIYSVAGALIAITGRGHQILEEKT